jgi:hypothetical protein
MTEVFLVVEAFADGERVDADRLKVALADEHGRAHFVDVLVLRELVGQRSGVVLPDGLPVVGGASDHARPAVSWSSGFVAVAAAAALLVSLGAGFAAGWGVAGSAMDSGDGSPSAIRPAGALPPVEAPAPTRVIRFEPGVDWSEGTGGN